MFEVFEDIRPRLIAMGESNQASDWPRTGAECTKAYNASFDWERKVLPTPDEKLTETVTAYLEKMNEVFFWCKGGDRASVGSAAAPHAVADELYHQIIDFGISSAHLRATGDGLELIVDEYR